MSEVYKNAPLARAILEARFPGETAIEVARPLIQHAIRSELPQLHVPKFAVDTAPALQPYVFRSPDQSEQLEVAVNRVNYVTTRYEGYEVFKARALHFMDLFRERVPQVQKLNRVGLRYINHIPLLKSAPDAAIPLADYLNLKVQMPDALDEAHITELNLALSVPFGSGVLRVVLRHEAAELGAERLVLDFDFGQLQDLVIHRLNEYVDIAHAHTKRFFETLIAERYFPVMRGENS